MSVRRNAISFGALVGFAFVVAACGAGAVALPADADDQLRLGQQVYSRSCASCHGGAGGGGLGTQLSDGKVLAAFPDEADQAALISDGRKGMPAFGERLSEDEIAAVVRYTREFFSVES